MKLHTMLIAAGLVCMTPIAGYAETNTSAHDSKVHHSSKKDHSKRKMAKGKKPLTAKETKEMEMREKTTNPPSPENTDVK